MRAGASLRSRDGARDRPRSSAAVPTIIGALLVVLSAAAAQPDLVTLAGPPASARLELPLGYVLLSPVSRVCDALSLLSLPQHVALWCTALAVWMAWWRGRRVRPRRASLVLAAMAATTFASYAAATLLERPMARLVAASPDVVRVDVHAHTNASPDVPRWFDVGRRRAWHAAGGFDAAYVSDHRSWRGVRLALTTNPRRAGDGVVLLSALEGYVGDLNAVFLGATPADSALVVRQHLDAATLATGRPPLTIATIPGPVLATATAATRDTPPFMRAVEIVDGAPKGLWQGDRERNAIDTRAESLGITRVAGSNHHGWGRTVVAWNLLRIPGWRTLAPSALGGRIEDAIGAGAVTVVARRRPGAASWLAVGATVPTLVWQTATTLHPPERAVWLAWLAALAAIARLASRRRGLR